MIGGLSISIQTTTSARGRFLSVGLYRFLVIFGRLDRSLLLRRIGIDSFRCNILVVVDDFSVLGVVPLAVAFLTHSSGVDGPGNVLTFLGQILSAMLVVASVAHAFGVVLLLRVRASCHSEP